MSNKFTVDRARFLAAAAAIAGIASFQACTVVKEDKNDAAAGADDGGSNATAGSKTNAAGQAGESGSQGGAAGAAAGAGGTPDAGAGGVSSPEGGAGAGGAGGAGGASTCSDAAAVAPTCAGVSDACDPYCNAALANLKPAAAADAVTCLKLDATANCDAGYGCLSEATAHGCPEDVAAACTAAAVNCDPAEGTEPSCEQLLSGFNDAARAQVISCTGDQGCFSVYSCAEGFFFQ